MGLSEGAELPGVFDDLNVGITLHHPRTGAVFDINERLEQLYGYSSEEFRSMEVEEYTARSTRFTQEEAERRIRAAAEGDPQRFEWQIRRKNGEIRWVRVHLNASTVNGESCVLAEVHDITEQRDRERRLRLLSRIIRHNLRNRAQGLIGYAQNIERAVEEKSLEDEVDTLVTLAKDVGELSDSVSQLEEIVSLDSSSRSPTDLGEFLPPLIEEFRGEATDVSITATVESGLWVMSNQGLEYALEHVLENAVEHNPSEDALLEVTTEGKADAAIIEIRDNGPVIPEGEIEVLDEAVETSNTYHGAGVGLWVIQWAVSSLGGDLAFAENSYGGNTVTITLPKVEQP